MHIRAAFLIALLTFVGCSQPQAPASDIEVLAHEYLFLELSMGVHDEDHVDAYFGPEEIRTQANSAALGLDEIAAAAVKLVNELANLSDSGDEVVRQRIFGLLARLEALQMRVAINKGDYASFDDETSKLFATTAPDYDAAHFEAILTQIDELLPGLGPLGERVEAFRKQFYVPEEKRAAVFEAALAECRRRTSKRIELPDNEAFTIEYVTDKPWGGYNWYKGNATSLIQVNTDLPASISRAVDLGCHEGYPGHHVYNALIEKNLVEEKGWVEFSLYPLFSPQSLLAEGTAEYGVDLVFPKDERIQFEKDVLFPLAGLDASEADKYYELLDLLAELGFADNEAARDYLDGTISREEAIDWLVSYALINREKAKKKTHFYDAYRSYVINYNHGKHLVAEHVERGEADLEERWKRFEALLSSAILPEDL